VAYHFTANLTWTGRLDVAALSAALTELVSRHEVLRTTFEQVDGLPRQRVHPPWFVKLESHPASYLEIESWTAQESRRPFNLGSLPLIRWHLFQISENEHQLIHIEHHLLHDGWSFAVLLRELFAIYECLIKKEAHSLEPPDWQPSDIAMKERQWIGTEDAKKQLSFWSRSLEKIPKILDLPTDHVRPSSESFAGDAVRFSLDAGLAKKIEDFNRQRGLTLHMTLRAIFEALVHRLTGSKHFIIGSGTANRATSALENSVGMILNNLALPADVSGEPNLEELVSRVRATAIAALDNQAIPFDHVVKAVDTERSAQRTPLCQVFFSSYDGPIPNFGLRDVTVETRFGVNNGSAKFDLNVIVIALPMLDPTAGSGAKASKSIEMIWEYKTDLFTQETIKRWGSCFEKLLETALANPNTSITRLPIMPDAEKEKTLVTFNQTQREYPRKATINQLFESIAKAHPDREAIVYKERSLTYRELDDMAEAIVSEMSSKGISLGSRVGVCLNRSPEAIATILGVLKAGAVYVPINPNDPRRTVLADRAGLKLIISEDGWTVRPEPEPDLTPSEPAAYIMFTSGSTGEPKGVLVTHQNVVRLVQGTDFVRFGPDEVFLQLSPLTFDASTFEIWGALLHGSKLVLWPDQAIETVELRNMIRQHGISTLWLTSSLLHVVAQDNPNILNGIRQLIAGGDVLHPHDLAEIRKCFPDLRMVNGYGPTECTTFSCCYVLPSGTISDAAVPIGSPIANTTAYVLSDCFEPQPLGIPGELFIGGDGVALGYIGEPALTAEKFVSDPWGRPNGRLYRTGDRVRWLPTGVLEFIGRLDRQVKVRGYRIEPAEVERIMASLPGVRDVAVSTPPDDVSGHRLHAFLVTDNSSDAASIRAKLIDRVPDFMIPSGFTFLEELPLGPTGKVDRSRLVVPKPPVEEHLPHLVVARSATEERLARIWERLLGSNHVSVNDPFFDIGGHSLLALKLVHEINLQFNLELPVRFVINEVTISRQAKAIDHLLAYTNPRKISFPIVVALREEGHRKPFFLVAGGFGGEAELLVYAKLTDHLDPEQPFYGLRIPGVDDLVEPASIEEIAAQHVREIQAIQPTGPYQIGGSCIGGVVAFEIAQQLLAQGQTISRLVLVDSRYPSKFWYYRYVARRAVADFRDQKTSIFRLMKKPRGQDIPSMKNHIGKSYLRRTLRYRPRPYPGKIVLIISEAQRRRKPARVWIQLAKKGLDLRYVPGDHFSHLRQYACETGRQITECLRNSDGEQKRGVATQSRQPNVQSKVSLG
jgi:amino acid adenylation domain-containing protein